MNHEPAAPGGPEIGARRFVLDRMAEPEEVVSLVARVSGSDGLWVVRSASGAEFVVAADRLSTTPAEEFYRGLARRSAAT